MKITKKRLRMLIQESLERRTALANDMIASGLVDVPTNKFAKNLVVHGNTVYKDSGKEVPGGWGDLEMMGEFEQLRNMVKAGHGSKMKSLFMKHVDQNFLNSLILCHFVNSEMKLFHFFKTASNKDEMSVAAYLPEDFEKGIFDTPKTWLSKTTGRTNLGIIISGQVTYLTNNQDDAYTGWGPRYKAAFSEYEGHLGRNDPRMKDNIEVIGDDQTTRYRKERNRDMLTNAGENPFAGTDRGVSSGDNKVPLIIPDVERVRQPEIGEKSDYPGGIVGKEIPIVLSAEDWNPRIDYNTTYFTKQIGNEALVDNWRPIAVICANNFTVGNGNQVYEDPFNPKEHKRIYFRSRDPDVGNKKRKWLKDVLISVGMDPSIPVLSFDEAAQMKASLVNNYR